VPAEPIRFQVDLDAIGCWRSIPDPPHRGEITTGESPARRASWRRTTSGPHHGVCAREDRYIQCPRSPRDDQTLGHRDGPHQHCIQHPHCDRPAKSPASAIEQPAATERMGREKRVATTVRICRFGLRHRHKASRLSTFFGRYSTLFWPKNYELRVGDSSAECDLSQSFCILASHVSCTVHASLVLRLRRVK